MGNKTPFFSVVIPTHNRPQMLKNAIHSVLQQTFSDYEIIVVNDGSVQSYHEVIQQFVGYPVKFIELPTARGVSAARNTGASFATGDWLIFLDDDDVYAKRCLEERFLNLQRNATAQTAFSWCNVKHWIVNDAGEETDSYYSNFLHCYQDDGELFAHAYRVGAGYGFAVKTGVFRQLNGFSEKYRVGEDTDLILRLIAQGYRPLINIGIGVIIVHHESEKLSKNMNNRSTFGVVDQLYADHILLLNRYLPLKMSYLTWSARTHFDAGNVSQGDIFFRLMVEMALADHQYMSWCKDIARYRNQLQAQSQNHAAAVLPTPVAGVCA